MTTDVSDSGRGDATGDGFPADEKNLNTEKNMRLFGNPVKVRRRKFVEENFQQRVESSPAGALKVPDNWNDLTVREQRDWFHVKMRGFCLSVPESLIPMCVASAVSGDSVAEREAPPEWLDREKFQRGQRFAMKNCTGVMFAEMLSLFAVFSFTQSLKPMIVTEKSSVPFTSFKRYLSTVKRVRSWYTSDVWTEGTEAHRDMRTVREMHTSIRKKWNAASFAEINEAATIRDAWSNTRTKIREDFRDTCPVPAPGQCPLMFSVSEATRLNFLNQGEMSCTQFGFMGLVLLYPERFGIHGASDDDLDAFVHVWRGLGYLLGIEDEFNFCNGTLEEVKQRSRDFLEYWVKPNFREITPEWEHMTRCVIEGIRFYLPRVTYEQCLLYLADILEIPMPRVRSSITYMTWIRLNMLKFIFNWTARSSRLMASTNRRFIMRIDKANEYTDDELEALRKKSEVAFSKGVAETVAAEKGASMTTRDAWPKAPLVVLSSAFVLLSLRIIKDYSWNTMRVGV